MTFDEWYEQQNKGHSDPDKADMRAAWNFATAQGADVRPVASDAALFEMCCEFIKDRKLNSHISVEEMVYFASNVLATRDATPVVDARPVAITEAMAEALGETGAPHSEAERKLYEAYCKGHCWAVGPWTGTEYCEMLDRIRFAVWRDRAAIVNRDAVPMPSDYDVRKILLKVVPGDGDGLEVYAKNVQEVENLLSEMGERLETYEATRATAEQSIPATVPYSLYVAGCRDFERVAARCDDAAEIIGALQKALSYWMPKVFDERSAHDAYLLMGYNGEDEPAFWDTHQSRDSVIEECASVCQSIGIREGYASNPVILTAQDCAKAIRALKSQQDAAIESKAAEQSAPEGWVLVPIEPKQEMMDAGIYQSSRDSTSADVHSIWKDMVAAAIESRGGSDDIV